VAFDAETFEVLDWTVHSATLADADGSTGDDDDADDDASSGGSDGTLSWSPLYTASEEYGLTSGQLNNR
jgi:hypothetical protein